MTVQTKPEIPATKRCPISLMRMEPLVCDIPRVAAVLMNMSATNGEEIGWLGQQLAGIGK